MSIESKITESLLHKIKKNEVSLLLIAIEECKKNSFNVEGCYIDITLRENLKTNKKEYIISFYPREVTPGNVIEYQVLPDDMNVFIDAETNKVLRSHPSI